LKLFLLTLSRIKGTLKRSENIPQRFPVRSLETKRTVA
jgi:hypothetical protein